MISSLSCYACVFRVFALMKMADFKLNHKTKFIRINVFIFKLGKWTISCSCGKRVTDGGMPQRQAIKRRNMAIAALDANGMRYVTPALFNRQSKKPAGL